MPSPDGKVVLITGASSGIGEGTARVLAAHGARVVLGARRTDRLETIAREIASQGGAVRYRALDVASLDDVQAFADFAEAEFGAIDVIVNNAGVMPLSPLSALKIDEWNRMIDVNIRGVLHGIAAVLPRMEARGHGHVINVSSVGGFVVQPTRPSMRRRNSRCGPFRRASARRATRFVAPASTRGWSSPNSPTASATRPRANG